MLPNQAPPARPKRSRFDEATTRSAYSTVISRNIFNSTGVIPDPLVPEGVDPKKKAPDNVPVPSSLPLGLIGTIVHSNPEKSIATIELKGKSQVLAFTIHKDIDKIATLLSVERNKVIIRNLNNSRLEYLEMKQSGKISFSGSRPATSEIRPATEVAQVGQNKFEIKRSDLLKYTSDMASILQQASMVPQRNVNGEIDGFKFLSIQPGSIFTQLGFQNGDIIRSVNGEKVDSPAKAMELYNALKNSPNVTITVGRDGRDSDYNYSVK